MQHILRIEGTIFAEFFLVFFLLFPLSDSSKKKVDQAIETACSVKSKFLKAFSDYLLIRFCCQLVGCLQKLFFVTIIMISLSVFLFCLLRGYYWKQKTRIEQSRFSREFLQKKNKQTNRPGHYRIGNSALKWRIGGMFSSLWTFWLTIVGMSSSVIALYWIRVKAGFLRLSIERYRQVTNLPIQKATKIIMCDITREGRYKKKRSISTSAKKLMMR